MNERVSIGNDNERTETNTANSREKIDRNIRFVCLLNMTVIFLLMMVVNYNKDKDINIFDTSDTNHLLRQLALADPPSTSTSMSTLINDYTEKKKFIEKLVSHSFYGRWTAASNSSLFINSSGMFRLLFQNYLMRGPRGSYYNFLLFIHDGEDKEKWVFFQNSLPMAFNDNSTFLINKDETELTHSNLQVLVSQMGEFDLIDKKYEWVQFSLLAKNHTLTGTIRNLELEVTLDGSFTKDDLYQKVSNFSMVLSILAALQLLNSKHLMEKFMDNEAQALKYSSTVFLINIIWNGFICFTNFIISVYDDRLFNDFIVPTVIYFLNFSYFELRIVLYIWRAGIFRRGNASAEVTFKNKLMRLYIFLYCAMLLIYLYGPHIFFWRSFNYTIVAVTFLPQIWLNFKRGRRNVIPFSTVLIISLNKLYVPLYFRMCEKNFLDVPLDFGFALSLCAILVAQILVLVLQRIFGMRCLLPGFIMEKNVSYNRTEKELRKLNLDLEHMTCSICLGMILSNTDGSDIRVLENRADFTMRVARVRMSYRQCMDRCISKCNSENVKDGAYMYTPCHHLFHSDCLKAWVEIKNTCPECRSVLPVEVNAAIIGNIANGGNNANRANNVSIAVNGIIDDIRQIN